MKKFIFVGIVAILAVFGVVIWQVVPKSPPEIANTNNSNEETKENMPTTLKITLENHEFSVKLVESSTLDDILTLLPLELELSRYAEHEYYADLPDKITAIPDQTSELQAGHLYFWPGGNAFVVNFKDYSIAPYKSVHLGEITDNNATKILETSGKTVRMRLE